MIAFANFVRRRPASVRPSPGTCRDCAFFRDDPAYMESQVAGLTSFGSGNASVRGDDGLCERHGKYTSAQSACSALMPIEAGAVHELRASIIR